MKLREIHEHHINACNRAITLAAAEPEAHSRAPCVYYVAWPNVALEDAARTWEVDEKERLKLEFHSGAVPENETNGLTIEVLLAVLIDRLRCFRAGPYACEQNDHALLHLMEARDALFERTQVRAQRGVEGTRTP